MHIPPNWGIFFALIVSFLIFWFIFNRLFFRPFLSLLSAREGRLKEFGARTQQLLEEARAADEIRERRLAEVRRDALTKRESQRRQAESDAAALMEKAKADARSVLEEAGSRIDKELAAAERELEQMATRLASEVAERVLGRRIGGTGAAESNN
jgi:F-type H+-transporting ATPase subunit b